MAVTAALTGLQPGTTYYDQVVASSVGGTTNGTILSFTTPGTAAGHDEAATAVTEWRPQLNGSVNPQGSATSVVVRLRHRPEPDDGHDDDRRTGDRQRHERRAGDRGFDGPAARHEVL